jgi:hypothetical protein
VWGLRVRSSTCQAAWIRLYPVRLLLRRCDLKM